VLLYLCRLALDRCAAEDHLLSAAGCIHIAPILLLLEEQGLQQYFAKLNTYASLPQQHSTKLNI
jgi:hypothetical protein